MKPMHLNSGMEEQIPKMSSLASVIYLDLGRFTVSDDRIRRLNDVFM